MTVLDSPVLTKQYFGDSIPKKYIKTDSDRQAISEGCYVDVGFAEKNLNFLESNFGFVPFKWQREFLFDYFMWRNDKGGYRFNQIICFLPKKQGKSYLVAALMCQKLWELENSNIFSVATTSKQASLVLAGTISMMKNNPKLKTAFKRGLIKWFNSPYRREIENKIRGNTYNALTNNIGAADGIVGNVLVVDELHQMKNQLYDVVSGCTANIPGSLEVIISTAGDHDTSTRAYQKYDYAKRVLNNETIDTTILPIIYEFKDQKTRDPNIIYSMESMMSCNPILHESEELRKKVEKELEKERELGRIDYWRRFRLGVWCATEQEPFIDVDKWKQLEVEPITEEQKESADTFIGVDMSRAIDLSGVTLWHVLDDGRVYQESTAFIPEDRIEEASSKDDRDYKKYIEKGELISLTGSIISDEYVAEYLVDLCKKYNPVAVGLDRYFAEYVSSKVDQAGFNVFEIKQSDNRQQTVGINAIEELVFNKQLVHGKNSLYDWMLSCARRIHTSKQTFKVVKKNSNSKGDKGIGRIDEIDAGISCAIMYKHYKVEGDQSPSVFNG